MATTQGLISGNGDQKKTLVVVFLRGGADGLSLVAPIEDDDYYRQRPRLAVPKNDALKLEDRFGLNPIMKDLKNIYDDGQMAIVHAAGSEDATRSHFEAQDLMEHGGMVAGGWLGRYLRFRTEPAEGALSAVAIGQAMPEVLRGAPAATVVQSLNDFSFKDDTENLSAGLEALYANESDQLALSARDTFGAVKRIKELGGKPYHPEHGAAYASDSFSQGLLEAARLIKARVGLEVISVDLNGWDSHFTQETAIGGKMATLSAALFAFYKDLGDWMENVSVVVMSEFGRRLSENTGFGTGHGRGGAMFVIGGGVNGGRVVGDWKGLSEDVLEGPGDVPVLNNYRDVLTPVLQRHGVGEGLGQVFPEFELNPVEALYG